MATTHQDTNVNQLVINKMTKQEYENLSQVSENELWLVEEQVDSVVTQGSTNPVQSGAVYDAIQDIGGNINDGTTIFVKNQEIIGTTSANQSANQTITLPNDVVMCKMLENRALASYATPITRFKYIEDHGWVDMDRSDIQYNEGTGEWTGTFVSLNITEGEYYYDMDNKTVFVADENSEMQDVTSTVVIQDDINKLYCDVDTNILYRYNGSNFVALTSEGKTYTLSSNNENIRLTDSDGQTQDLSLSTLINGLSTGSSDPQDEDCIVAQYAGGGTTTTSYHRRPLSKFWNWIKSKLGIGTNDGTFLRKDGTWATPTDTKTTVTTTGSGNAITSLTASNGALTATKGATFLTSHQDISGKVSKSGDSMSGTLTFTTANAINYNANNGNVSMIRFKTGDTNGHGVIIGGGGLTVIGAGESASTVAAQASSGGAETMQVCSDEGIEFYTNCQSGFSSAKKSYFDSSGDLHIDRYAFATCYNQSSTDQSYLATSSSYIMFANSDGYLRKATVAKIKSLVDTNTWRPLGTGATDACAGNDSRLSNSRPASDVYAWAKASTKPSYSWSEISSKPASMPASDVYAWAKSASLAAAMQSSITSGSITSGTNCTCSVSWQQVGNLVSFTGYIKPNSSYSTSSSVRVAAPGTYKQTVYFGGLQTNKSAIFRLTATTGFLENEGPVTNETYYFQVIGIRVA